MSEEETEETGSEEGKSSEENHETILAPVEEPPSPPVIEEAIMDNSNPTTSSEVTTEPQHPDGSEDGWQPVQRPRSTGSYGRRMKQRRASIGKVYTYQKKNVEADIDNSLFQNTTQQNGKYYILKKRTASYASYADHHSPGLTTQGTKFGRKIVKTLAYRVKSMQPSSDNIKTAGETSEEDGLKTDASSVVPSTQSSTLQSEAYHTKNSVVSLGKSPSYKEVALAPPGSIAKYQVWAPQAEVSDKQEGDEMDIKIEQGTRDEQMITGLQEEVNEISADTESTKTQGEEEIKLELHSSEMVVEGNILNENEESGGGIHVEEQVEGELNNEGVTDMIHSTTEQEIADQLAADTEDLKQKLLISTTDSSDTSRGLLPNKKLSASAAPFNPSSPPSIIRPTPIGMNIGPSWPVNMTLHHGPPPPYPSPPSTPNLMQPMSFVYPPPYTQSVPTSTYPVTSGPFHPNQFPWQLNVSDFVPRTVWPGCHPVEFPPPHMITEPIAATVLEPTVILPTDIDTSGVEEGNKKEEDDEGKRDVAIADEVMDSVARSEKENGNRKSEDGEKTFSILLRGRRSRKQTLRMPISLLKPYDSQPFKLGYSRVIRDSEAPKSVA